MAEDNFKVTPWEVTGKVDYEKLIQQFGTQKITPDLLREISRFSGEKMHVMLRRNIFFSHRDLDLIIKDYKNGNGFFLYTGRAMFRERMTSESWVMTDLVLQGAMDS